MLIASAFLAKLSFVLLCAAFNVLNFTDPKKIAIQPAIFFQFSIDYRPIVSPLHGTFMGEAQLMNDVDETPQPRRSPRVGGQPSTQEVGYIFGGNYIIFLTFSAETR